IQSVSEVEPRGHPDRIAIIHQREIEAVVIAEKGNGLSAAHELHAEPLRIERLRGAPIANVQVQVIEPQQWTPWASPSASAMRARRRRSSTVSPADGNDTNSDIALSSVLAPSARSAGASIR